MRNDERQLRVPWAAIFVALTGLYVGGYFCLSSTPFANSMYNNVYRRFPARWMAEAYRPAGWAEAKFTGHEVVLYWREGREADDSPPPATRRIRAAVPGP